MHAAHVNLWEDKLAYRMRRLAGYAGFLFRQRVTGFTIDRRPDFDEPTIPLFVERLARTRQYLEFGSGASTILAAAQGVPFTTVETDKYFLRAVHRTIMADGRLDESKQRYIAAHIGLTEKWGAPLWRTPTPARVARWRAYAEAPWTGDAPSPDFILVDGRFRVACALTAIKHLSRDNEWELWLDDYLGRDHYSIVTQFARLERMSGVTAIFRAADNYDRAALDAAIDQACRDYR